MKIISLLIITILFLNCNNPKHIGENYIKNKQLLDTNSIDTILTQNKIYEEIIKENSDIKIIKARLSKNPYSDHKDIYITFKNLSKKPIKAIKFEWFCINSFDEPANGKYFYGQGRYKEKYVNLIKPGEIQTEHWEDFSTDASKITKIRAYYIVYTDGSKWGFTKEDDSL